VAEVLLRAIVVSFLYVFAGLLLLKLVLNVVRYVRTKRYHSRYTKWVDDPDWKFHEYRAQVVRLLKDAGVEDNHYGVTRGVGHGRTQVANASVLANFPSTRADFVAYTHRMFRQAIGTYRARILETFNPLYWIETILYLPREALKYLGIPPENVFVKLLQLVWWALGTIAAIVYLAYKPEIGAIVRAWLSNLTQ
jgi:hypothetical protein